MLWDFLWGAGGAGGAVSEVERRPVLGTVWGTPHRAPNWALGSKYSMVVLFQCCPRRASGEIFLLRTYRESQYVMFI